MNGDPFIGMLETPVTSAPVVAGFLSNLPAYRTGVSPLLRGVEVGLAHGLLVRDLPRLPPMHSATHPYTRTPQPLLLPLPPPSPLLHRAMILDAITCSLM